ncbi:hypothetical protein CKAH01_02323 [Colletotrichum kahawae]|uniref:Uncharacterized protein n=1 Tax=Colletotrichum kahawae TaxID=34407 RepID=A0AAD9XZY1_COLKA|nr:hypothetical protein CKAH01_02323 [Colletotrichum kahawae]
MEETACVQPRRAGDFLLNAKEGGRWRVLRYSLDPRTLGTVGRDGCGSLSLSPLSVRRCGTAAAAAAEARRGGGGGGGNQGRKEAGAGIKGSTTVRRVVFVSASASASAYRSPSARLPWRGLRDSSRRPSGTALHFTHLSISGKGTDRHFTSKAWKERPDVAALAGFINLFRGEASRHWQEMGNAMAQIGDRTPWLSLVLRALFSHNHGRHFETIE